MNELPDRQNAPPNRFSLPRLARVTPAKPQEDAGLEEPVREDLDENEETKSAQPPVKRPVPLSPPTRAENPPRDLRGLTPPSLARRPAPAPAAGNGPQRPQNNSTPVARPPVSRFESGAAPTPAARVEPRIPAPAPVSLPNGIQRGFPRQQNGSNGPSRDLRTPQVAPRPSTVPAVPAPAPQEAALESVKSALEVVEAAVEEQRVETAPARPRIDFFLEEVLDRFTNLPAQNALLGVCDDQLPVLLDLTDPAPGAILAISDDDLLRTRLLRTLAQTAAAMNSPRNVQFIIFSAWPEEWQEWIEGQEIMRHCLSVERMTAPGEEPSMQGSPERWLLKLSGWADQRRSGGISGPAVVLIVDDLQCATAMEYDARVNFDWLLKEGPAVRIWPVVGMKTSRAKELSRWVRLFKTRILGPAADAGLLKQLSADDAIEVDAAQFAVRVQDSWLKFRVPILPNEAY